MIETTQPASAGEGAAPVADASQAVATNEAPVNDQKQPAEADAPETDKSGDESRKIQNALARKERRIGQLTAQKHERDRENETLRQKLAQYEKAPQSEASGGKPNPQEFFKQGKTYEDYLDASAEWAVEQRLSKRDAEAKKQSEVAKKDQWKQERGTALSQSVAKAKESFPEYQSMLEEHAEILNSLPEHIGDAILEAAEDAPAGFFALVKEDRLDDLLEAGSTPAAVRILAKASVRAESLTKSRQVTKAPAPLSPAKGTASGSKNLDQMSGHEVRNWAKS